MDTPTLDATDRPADETGLRARKRRALRERIVTLAGERFMNVGFEATNMREIADAAGIAYQTLYNHYPSKARLAMAWFEARTLAIASRLERSWNPPPDDPVAALQAAADAWFDIVEHTERTLQREVIAEYVRTPEAFGAMTAAIEVAGLGGLHTALANWRDAGRLQPSADIEALGGALFAIIDHAMLRYVGLPGGADSSLHRDAHRQIEALLRPWVRAEGGTARR